MAVKIQVRRGSKAGLPKLSPGEFGFATDTKELFIGGQSGNIQVASKEELNAHVNNKSNPHGVTAAQVGAVPTGRKVNGKALSSDITISAADVNAVPTNRTVNGKALSSDITISAADVNAVPTTRTVNGKALKSNITLGAADVNAVPTNRTVNGKALSSNITLSASDVGAATTTYVDNAIGGAIAASY